MGVWDSAKELAKRVVPLFKKGDKRVCANYRGITLLSLPGNVYSKVLKRRVRPIFELLNDLIGTMRWTSPSLSQGSWRGPGSMPIYMCFVDLEKAYNRVPQEIVLEVL